MSIGRVVRETLVVGGIMLGAFHAGEIGDSIDNAAQILSMIGQIQVEQLKLDKEWLEQEGGETQEDSYVEELEV